MIAVIGAGLSGLACARELSRAGREVRVFDKARGGGGRSSTRRRHELSFDHGAQYFVASKKPFLAQVKAWQKQGEVALWDSYVANLPSRTPAREERRYVGVPGMSQLCKSLGLGLDISFKERIHSVEGRPGAWTLVNEKGQEFGTFDTCLISTPPEQAAPLLAGSKKLQGQAASIESLPCWAAMMSFPEQVPVEFEAAWVEEGPFKWLAANHTKPGRPRTESWVGHATSEWSVEHLEKTPDQVARALAEEFQRLCGAEADTVQAHRWRYARPGSPLGVGCLWDVGSRLGACGDWCSAVDLESVYLSGLSLAQRVLG